MAYGEDLNVKRLVTTMAFDPGNKYGNRKGRPKGATNRYSKELKEMVLGALDDAGGQEYLRRQANENPGPFLTLVGKVLPKEVSMDANVNLSNMTDEELDERIAALAAQAGFL